MNFQIRHIITTQKILGKTEALGACTTAPQLNYVIAEAELTLHEGMLLEKLKKQLYYCWFDVCIT